MRQAPLPLFAAAAAVLFAACTPGTVASPSPVAPLDGHTYLSTDIDGAVLVPGTQVRLTFKDGNLNAQGGCNIMGGTYSIDGNRLRTTQTFMTEMACDEPLQAQDEWLSRFLGDLTYTLVGDSLTLTDGTVSLTLLDEEVATPDRPLGITADIEIAGGKVDVRRQHRGGDRGGPGARPSGGVGDRRSPAASPPVRAHPGSPA